MLPRFKGDYSYTSNDDAERKFQRGMRRDSVQRLLGINADTIEKSIRDNTLMDDMDDIAEDEDAEEAPAKAKTVARQRLSFSGNVLARERRKSLLLSPAKRMKETALNLQKLNEQITTFHSDIGGPFETKFKPDEMRQLALVAHNHMKPAMKRFVETHAEFSKSSASREPAPP